MSSMWPIFLFGQDAGLVEVAGGADSPPMVSGMMVMLLAGLAALALVVVLGMRARQRRREMEHAERMRAIELGRPIAGADGARTPSRTAAGIGVGVPIAIFVIASLATSTPGASDPFIWCSAGAVGVAAVICGTILAARLPSPRPADPDPRAKPYVDPDAFDLAEHRHS